MAKKQNKRSEAGRAFGMALGAIGLASIGAAIGMALGGHDDEMERRVKRLEKRTNTLHRRMDRLSREAGAIEIITPVGCYGTDLFDEQDDLEA